MRTWSWRYGEAEARKASGHHLKEASLVKSFTYALAQGLGGPSMPESQLRRLFATACREPDDIAPGSITDSMLSRHAAWAASAMLQVIYAISRPSLQAASDDKKYIAAAQVMRCLHIFLRAPAADPRWKTTVVAALSVAELPVTQGTRQLREAWRNIILTEVQKYVAQTVPGLEPAPDFKRCMTALHDPNLLRTGRLLDFWSAPDDER